MSICNRLPKIDEICLIAKESNALIIDISESKLHLFIWNGELEIEFAYYVLMRQDHSSARCRVACYIRKPLYQMVIILKS